MRKLLLAVTALSLFAGQALHAQSSSDSASEIYRAFAPKINDLVHTVLDVRFDYKKQYLYGKEWVTLKPHFYPADVLQLDARGMDIHRVAIARAGATTPLKYSYDGQRLTIHLDKTYHAKEKYTVFIDYTAKPNELKFENKMLAQLNRGLFFVNPD